MRLIVVYSTDDYPKLNTNHSPFNVGVLIKPPEFTQQQFTELAQLYELQLDSQAVNSLIALVGGNPYLVTRALDCFKNQSLSLEQLLQTAPTEEGIYSDRLRQLLWSLQQNPQLKAAFEQVVTSRSPVLLDGGVPNVWECDIHPDQKWYIRKPIADKPKPERIEVNRPNTKNILPISASRGSATWTIDSNGVVTSKIKYTVGSGSGSKRYASGLIVSRRLQLNIR